LEIRLFGAPRLFVNGHPKDDLRRKNRALIYYVAAQGGQSTREKLFTFFWPDHDRSAAQSILRTMIHDLRKQLGPAFQADDRTITLASDAVIDVQEFLASLQSADSDPQKLTQALNLYKGDFLEGFSLSDTPQFDDWAASEREHYRLMAMNGFADLSHRHEALRVSGCIRICSPRTELQSISGGFAEGSHASALPEWRPRRGHSAIRIPAQIAG
jgi:DNA-binding SARP family transcriptional activator